MLKKIVLFSVFALITKYASAQEKSILQVHLFPLTALEIDGGIRAGAELCITPKFSIMADYNHLLSALDKDKSRTNLQGFALRIEPRFFILPEKSYLALQLSYKSKIWKFKNDSIAPEMEKYIASIKFGKKSYLNMAMKANRKTYKNNNLGIDYYVGLGAGMKNNKTAFGEGFTRNKAGKFLTPNLLLGASLFYRF